MFLIRTAFWLTLLVLILPANEEDQKRLLGAAEATVKDLGSFCERNPGACDRAKLAFSNLGQKAEFGAKMVMDFINDGQGGGPVTEISGDPATAQPSVFQRRAQGTLTEDDLAPAWSAPKRDAGI